MSSSHDDKPLVNLVVLSPAPPARLGRPLLRAQGAHLRQQAILPRCHRAFDGEPKPRRRPVARSGSSFSKGEIMNRVTTDYARWLAEREGIEITGAPRLHTGFMSVTRHGRKMPEPRIGSVQFGEVMIDIPHWNFVPAEPVEAAAE